MLRFNRKVEYGLMAIKYLQEVPDEGRASARDIADSCGAPFDLLSKVLQRLHNHGIVKSVQGIRGGYRLDRNLAEINLSQFVVALEGPVALTNCMLKDGASSCDMVDTCNIIPPMTTLNTRINEVLSGMSLADVTQM